MSKKDKNQEIKYVAVPTADNATSGTNENGEEITNKKKVKYSYTKFVIKIIATAILLTFGIIILINKEQASFAILLVTGFATIILALIRIFTIVIRTNYKRTRILTFIEIALHCVIGLYLVFAAYNYNSDSTTGFAQFNMDAYHYFLAVILYTRALVYFWSTILYHEPTRKNQFWVHVVCMTLGCVIAGLPSDKFNPETLSIALAVLAFVGAVIIGTETGVGFFRYRKSVAPVKEKKKKEKKEDTEELPGDSKDEIDEPTDEDKKIIDPSVNDNTNDQPSDVV